jgi:hypothetical protein
MPDDIKHSHMVSPAHAAASAAARAAPLNFSTPETPMSEDPSALTPAIAADAPNPAAAHIAATTGQAPAAGAITISVYIDDGNVYDYDVKNATSAREHISAIIATGYRRLTEEDFTHYPAHRIAKVKAVGPGITTMYPDRARGT